MLFLAGGVGREKRGKDLEREEHSGSRALLKGPRKTLPPHPVPPAPAQVTAHLRGAPIPQPYALCAARASALGSSCLSLLERIRGMSTESMNLTT